MPWPLPTRLDFLLQFPRGTRNSLRKNRRQKREEKRKEKRRERDWKRFQEDRFHRSSIQIYVHFFYKNVASSFRYAAAPFQHLVLLSLLLLLSSRPFPKDLFSPWLVTIINSSFETRLWRIHDFEHWERGETKLSHACSITLANYDINNAYWY